MALAPDSKSSNSSTKMWPQSDKSFLTGFAVYLLNAPNMQITFTVFSIAFDCPELPYVGKPGIYYIIATHRSVIRHG